jgi:hypothetical protein
MECRRGFSQAKTALEGIGACESRMTHDELRSLYHAFNARDIEAILVFMRHDVDWPDGQEGGRVYGYRGVRE